MCYKRTIIESCLLRIANVLSLYAFDITGNGLLSGKTGASIFLYKYGLYFNEPTFSEIAKELIEDIGKNINLNPRYDFGNGLPGIGWGFEYLIQNGCGDVLPYIETIENLINAEVLKETLLIRNSIDYYGYGLFYLQKQKRVLKENDLLKSLMINQMINTIAEDCERILTKKQILGNPVPKFTLNQLNSIFYFISNLKELNIEKYEKLVIYMLNYYTKMQDKACDVVDLEFFNRLIDRTKNDTSDKILEKLSTINIFKDSIELSPIDIFSKTNLYRMLYSENFRVNQKTISQNIAFEISNNERYWEGILDNIVVEELSIQNGLAGLGLALLDSYDHI